TDTKVYDATTSSAGTPLVSGLLGNDNVGSVSQSFTSPNVMGANGSKLVVNGGYALNDGNGGNNYAVTLQSAAGAITPAALAITYTANSATSIYGQAITSLSGSVGAQGLQGSDSLAGVTSGTASFTTTATAQSSVGSYAIDGSGLSGNTANYNFSFLQAPGNATALTIDPATLSVVANAQSRSYGATNPALTYSDTGLVNGDTLSGSLVTSATPAANVGAYAITQGTLSASSNYTLNYTGANLTVNPASLTVTYTANPANSIYGNAPSGLTGSETAAGLVNNDTLASVTSGAASFNTTATGGSNVGSYAINGSGLSGNTGNYSFSFVQAPGNATALTITPRPITVIADPQRRAYGLPDPALTYAVTYTATDTGMTTTPGLVNGDQLTGQLASTDTRDSPAGQYDILQGTLAASPNYRLSYVGNILTVVDNTAPLVAIGNEVEASLHDQIGVETTLFPPPPPFPFPPSSPLPSSSSYSFSPGQNADEATLAALLAGGALHPPAIVQSLINDQRVTSPAPVNEPVTSNGNASLWLTPPACEARERDKCPKMP
ncbi:MAG TPA: MBG domain-containing protein, partial [Dongiaceae bacterium]|nr:MBG domain-containing protein [Dongiaceae bacterium]